MFSELRFRIKTCGGSHHYGLTFVAELFEHPLAKLVGIVNRQLNYRVERTLGIGTNNAVNLIQCAYDVVAASNDTTEATISVSFLATGDSVTCTGTAHNYGSVTAELGTVTPNITGLTDIDGAEGDVTADLSYGDDSAYAVGDVLAAGATKDWKLVLTYTGAGELTSASTPVTFSYAIPYIEAAE